MIQRWQVGACTLTRVLDEADTRARFLGTHFAARPAGRVERQGGAFVFVPL